MIGIPAKQIAEQAKEARGVAPKPITDLPAEPSGIDGLAPSRDAALEPTADAGALPHEFPTKPLADFAAKPSPEKPAARSGLPKPIADLLAKPSSEKPPAPSHLPKPFDFSAKSSEALPSDLPKPIADLLAKASQDKSPSPGKISEQSSSEPATSPSSVPPSSETADELRVVSLSPGPPPMSDAAAKSGKADSERADPYAGRIVDDRYKLEKLLGEGGMGVVYQCRHTIIDKKVAMKILRADLARDQEATRRFLNEAKSASAIGNPHIIDISDFGRLPDGSTYFVMEYLEGQSLSSVIKSHGPVSPSRILHIARQLAEALAAAHRAGIVHRDLKPDNIFLIERGTEQDFVKILDFGIAKVSGGEGRVTRAGAVFGTPHYMSPEQAAGDTVDHRGDIYSLGVILYELAAGKVPFDAENFMGILTQHIYKTPMPLRSLEPTREEVPPGLEAIILKCLSKKAENRYASMEDVCADLDSLAEGFEPSAVPDLSSRTDDFNVPVEYFRIGVGAGRIRSVPPPPRFKSRWPAYAAIGGALVVVIGVAVMARSAAAPPDPEPIPSRPALPTPREPARASEEGTPAADKTASGVIQVALAVDPLDAHVFRGDQDLGKSPVLVEVAPGDSVEVTLRRPGYQSQTITLDGSVERRSVTLQKETPKRSAAPGKRPAGSASSSTRTRTRIGGGDIVNPWD